VAEGTLREASDASSGQWHRLHPLTPVLQGGVVVVAVLTAAVFILWENLILPTLLVFFGVDDELPDQDLWRFVQEFLGWIAVFALLLVVVLVVIFWLQWRVHVFRMDDDVIDVKKGLLVKTWRQARRDRVNTIGVRRPLLPRLLGLAKLDIQAAGNDANVVLEYLPVTLAQDLRRLILQGDVSERSEEVEQRPQREVDVPLFRYVGSLVASVETVVLLTVITTVSIFAIAVGDLAVWLAVVLALFVYVVYLVERTVRWGNFVVDSLSGDLRVSVGLLATSVETIPPQRIHTLEFSQPWPWKLFGWWRLNANLASQPGAATNKAPEHTVIIPVATVAEVMKIVRLGMPGMILGEVEEQVEGLLSQPRKRLTGGLGSPRRGRWRNPFSAHLTMATLQPGLVVMRRGLLTSRISVTPLTRIQSASVSRGPWHRALGLSQIHLHSVAGPVSLRASALDSADARKWWEELNIATHTAVSAVGSRPAKGEKA
jgi:putative membrane protein